MTSVRCLKVDGPSNPSLSVLIRVKNEGRALLEFWNRLSSQTIFEQLEIIFLDSGSTDGSLDEIKKLAVSIYQISAEDFNFGSSCNLLMSLSCAPVAVFLSGHVLLEQSNALEVLYETLIKHTYAAAFFRQVPNELWGATIYEQAHLSRRYPLRREQVVRLNEPGGFSNAASGLTRGAWQRLPFPEINGSEDQAWAAQHLELGGLLYYLPFISVMHSHCESPAETFGRVLLNVRAKKIKGSYISAGYYLVGVFVSMIHHKASVKEAWHYALAHSRAYLPKWANVNR